jgi:ATP-dependent Clp protease ATP-binding subunit ClpA
MSDEGRPAQTPRYSQAVDGSAELAREMGHSYVGVEHLFLAIIRDRAAVPTQALARLIDLDQVEAGLLEVMASPGYAGQPPADAVWFPRSELRERLAAMRNSVAPGTQYGFNVAGDRAWIVVDGSG